MCKIENIPPFYLIDADPANVINAAMPKRNSPIILQINLKVITPFSFLYKLFLFLII